MRRSNRAFTLIEMLVVIAIIAVMAALLFPVLAAARAKGRNGVCVSNLRQIHLATALYLQDYDHVYPFAIRADMRDTSALYASQSWSQYIPVLSAIQDVLQPYCKSHEIFHCPYDVGKAPVYLQLTDYAKYGLSYSYDVEYGLTGVSDAGIADPTRQELADDVLAGWHTPDATGMHDRRGNVQFIDGHCKPFRYQDANVLYFSDTPPQ